MPGAVEIDVWLLDGNKITTHVSRSEDGSVLMQRVVDSVSPPIEQRDYFALSFDAPDPTWLEVDRPALKQLGDVRSVALNVKFYPPDPTTLDEYTRYLFYQQLRDRVSRGLLHCLPSTAALLGSYAAQADLGDYEPGLDHAERGLGPHDSDALRTRVATLHKSHRGLTTAEAESNYLEVAKRLAGYGVHFFDAFDRDSQSVKLGICASGIVIFSDLLRIARHPWRQILKMSYKKSVFSLKFNDDSPSISYKFSGQKQAKKVWRLAQQTHIFFRLVKPDPKPKKVKGGKPPPPLHTEYQLKKAQTLSRDTPAFVRVGTLPQRHKAATLDDRALRRQEYEEPPSPSSGDYIIQQTSNTESIPMEPLHNGVNSISSSSQDNVQYNNTITVVTTKISATIKNNDSHGNAVLIEELKRTMSERAEQPNNEAAPAPISPPLKSTPATVDDDDDDDEDEVCGAVQRGGEEIAVRQASYQDQSDILDRVPVNHDIESSTQTTNITTITRNGHSEAVIETKVEVRGNVADIDREQLVQQVVEDAQRRSEQLKALHVNVIEE